MTSSVLQNSDFTLLCRICLKSDLILLNLFETEASKMLEFCGFLELSESNQLPDKICSSCNYTLHESYKLKRLCVYSEAYFKSYLDNLQAQIDTVQDEQYYDDEKVLIQYACEDLEQTEEKCENSVDELIEATEFPCGHCKSKFENSSDLDIHQSIHAEDTQCNVCGKHYETLKTLKRHIKTHMTSTHTCPTCFKNFTEKCNLDKHIRKHHMNIPIDKKYKCKFCPQSYPDKYYLEIHQRKHSGEKPLQCDRCHKAFYDPRSLKVHLDTHDGFKSYLCNICGRTFVQKAHLRQHLTVHSGKKAYRCDICDKKFTQAASLHRHFKVHVK